MNYQAVVILTVLLASSLAVLAQSRSRRDSGSSSTSSEYREEFGVLAERNMFMRDRRKPEPPPTSRPAVVREPEQNLVLTGVVFEPLEAVAYAFFEDLSAGSLVRVRVGDKVARGTIQAIDINAVAYEREGKQTVVAVGDDLTGSRAAVGVSTSGTASSSASSGSGTPAATSAPAIDPNNPNLTLEERMKLRRQQQLQ